MYIKCDKIYFPNQIIKSGYLTIKDGKVGEVVKEIPNSEEYIDYTGYSIIPGFIDQHLHGWGTGSFGNDKSVHSINEMKTMIKKTLKTDKEFDFLRKNPRFKLIEDKIS